MKKTALIVLLFSIFLSLASDAFSSRQHPMQQSTPQQTGRVLSAWTHKSQGSSEYFDGKADQFGSAFPYVEYVNQAEWHTDVQVGDVVYETDQVHKQVQVGKDYPVTITSDEHGSKQLALAIGRKIYIYGITHSYQRDTELDRGGVKVEGLVTDINGARIGNGTLTFKGSFDPFDAYTFDEYTTQAHIDGVYSVKLRSGTYRLTIHSNNFCIARRAAFVVHTEPVRFNLQLWACPARKGFIHYKELNQISGAHLRPLVLFGKSERQGDVERFVGAEIPNDGTGHPGKYPAVLTFNLLTVQADEIAYNRSRQFLTARGNVTWKSGDNSGRGNKIEIRLDGLDPRPVAPD